MTGDDLIAAAARRSDDARQRIPSPDGLPSWTTLTRSGACRLRVPPQINSGQTITRDAYLRWEARNSPSPDAQEPSP